MKTRLSSWLCVALSALIFTTAAWADDLKAMEGRWKVEAVEVGGKAVEPPEMKEVVVTVAGDRLPGADQGREGCGNVQAR